MKLFNKIALTAVGAFMAIGASASALLVKPESKAVYSEGTTYTMTFKSTADTFDPALPASSATANSSVTNHEDKTAGISIAEKKIYQSNGYLMLVQNAGYFYNTEPLSADISSITTYYSSGTSTSAKVGVYFGSSVLSTYTTSDNITIAGTSKSDTFTNTASNMKYFQISSSNKNLQLTQVVIECNLTSDVITSLSVSPTEKNCVAGSTIAASDFTASVTKNDAAGSIDDLTAEVGTKEAETFTPRADVVFGTTKLIYGDNCIRFTAKYPTTAGGSTLLTADVNLTTSYAPVTDITVNSTLSIDEGKSTKITATVNPEYANPAVTFESSNTGIATVDANGNVTGVAAGTCNVTVTSVGLTSTSTTVSKTIAVTVNAGSFFEYSFTAAGFSEIAAADNISSVSETISAGGEFLTLVGENAGGVALRLVSPATKGQQFGTTNNPFTSFSITTNNFGSKKITKVSVILSAAANASSATVNVKVGGTSFGSSVDFAPGNQTETTLDFAGTGFGNVCFDFTDVVKGIYIKSILVYGGNDTSDVALANAFARTCELANSCASSNADIVTTYETLSVEVKALADAIIIHDWNGTNSDKGSRTLAMTVEEKMTAIYESLSSSSRIMVSSDSTITIIVIIGVASVSLVSAYFLLRKKKFVK